MRPFLNMAETVGRIKDSNLYIKDEIDERGPIIEDGLISYHPLDESRNGERRGNMEDTSTWVVGTSGSQSGFGQNGETSANEIIMFTNPWGGIEPTWASLGNDTTSNGDGGWNGSYHNISSTQTYRLSVWMRRENAGSGRSYFGCHGNDICTLSGTVNGNPYFGSRLVSDVPEMEDNWVLWVAFIHPHTYSGGDHPDSGIYMQDGSKLGALNDFKWSAGATLGRLRTYLFYSTSTTERHYWVRPRFEMVDGNEATVEDLLMGRPDICYNESPVSTPMVHGLSIGNATTNIAPHDGSFSSCSGRHVGDPDLPNSNQTALGGLWQVATHYNDAICEVAYSDTLFGYHKVLRWTHGKVSGWKGITATAGWTAEVGKTYTVTVYARANQYDPAGWSGSYGFYGDSSNRYSFYWDKNPLRNPGEWVRGICTFSPTTTQSGGVYLYGVSNGEQGLVLEYSFFQIEESMKPNSWAEASQGKESLTINYLGGHTEYTIVGKFKPYSPFDGYYDKTDNGAMLIRVSDTVNGGNFYYRYWAGGSGDGISRPYLDPDGHYLVGTGSGHIHESYPLTTDPIFYAVRKKGTQYRIKIYQNGQWKNEHVGTTNASARLDQVAFGDPHVAWSGVHSDIGIYKREMSDEELNKIVQTKMSVRKRKIITPELREDSSYLERYMNSYFHHTGEMKDGWSKYEQAQMNVVPSTSTRGKTKYSYFIQCPPNLDHSVDGNVMWGGVVFYPPKEMKHPGKYKISFWYKGHSAPRDMGIYAAYTVGWSSYGVGLNRSVDPPNIAAFSHDEWVKYEHVYEITDADVYQVGTDGVEYDCLTQFKIGFSYGDTDAIGTRVFIDEIEISRLDDGVTGIKTYGAKYSESAEDILMNHIYVMGTGYPATGEPAGANTHGNKIIRLNGTDIHNGGNRGLTLTIFNENMGVLSTTHYDVYGVDADRTSLANAINSMSLGYTWALASYDAIRSNATLDQAMNDAGSRLWNEIFASPEPRRTYAAVGRGREILYEDGSGGVAFDKHKAVISRYI